MLLFLLLFMPPDFLSVVLVARTASPMFSLTYFLTQSCLRCTRAHPLGKGEMGHFLC